MRGLTITADDFGLCPEVNDAICLLHDRGVVSRTSFMVNTEHFDASVTALRRRPGLQVGVHLNLTDGRPVLPVDRVRSLVNARGTFRGGRHCGVALRILSHRMRRDEIRREWEAQIGRARDAGIAVMHLNAHGHLHLLPPLHGIVVDLMEQFGIHDLRVVLAGESVRGFAFRLCSRGLVAAIRRRGLAVAFADRVLGLGHQGALDRARLTTALTQSTGASELLVHPATGANAYHRRWRYRGEQELDALLDDARPPFIQESRTGDGR